MKQLKRTALLLLMAIFGSCHAAFADWVVASVGTADAPVTRVTNTSLPAGMQITSVDLKGDGTEAHPFEIGSVEQWTAFATIANKADWEHACAILTADITFTGNHLQPGEDPDWSYTHTFRLYKDIFDGRGHTITLNQQRQGGINSSKLTYGGLFWHVARATIKNLRVAGRVNAGSSMSAAFIQNVNSNIKQPVYIENCVSSVDNYTSGNYNKDKAGGFVSDIHKEMTLNMNNCLMDGKFSLSSTDYKVTYSGGFVGYAQNAFNGSSTSIVNIHNSFFQPQSTDASFDNFFTFSSGGELNYDHSYYLFSYSGEGTITYQGSDASGMSKTDIVNGLNTDATKVTINNQQVDPWVVHNDTIYLKTFAKYVDIQGWTYGSPNEPTIVGNSGNGTVTYKYKVQGAADGTYATYTPGTTVLGAGNYTLKASVAANNGWNAWESKMDFTVSPRPITVTPDEDQGKTYGEEDPTLTYSVDNIVTGESLSGSLSRDIGSNVGSFDITQGSVTDANNSNYTITFTSGKTFVITPKPVTLSWSATSFDYDGSAKAPTAAVSNLVSGDACDVTVSVTGDHSAIGTYTATAELDNPNYALPADPTTTYYIVRLLDGMSFSGSKHWNSYYAAENLATPEGITAYIITGVSGTTATASSISYIPQNVGVLLYSESALSEIRAKGYSGDAGTFTSNKLVGVTAATSLAAEAGYILYGDAFVLTTGGTLPANRCYLPASGPASSRGLNIDTGDGTTFINAISKDEMNDERWFDLQGQRIARPQKKGIYIRDGKKVVIK